MRLGSWARSWRRNERDTFAGLRIQHQPDFRVIVEFTSGGEETMARYLKIAGWPTSSRYEMPTFRWNISKPRSGKQCVLRRLRVCEWKSSTMVSKRTE